MNEVKCLRCGKNGHLKRDCLWANGGCFGCGQSGHMVGQCPNPRPMECFRCGRMGHIARECGRRVNGRNDSICGNCGQAGHYARMCRAPRSTCGNCGLVGHTTSVCRRAQVAPVQAAGIARGNAAPEGQGNLG